jgi:GNAT superfamily N-acetyltransferase
MNQSIHIRTFKSNEWRTYRALRIAALRDAPDAYGGTLEQALARPDDVWQSRLDHRNDQHHALLGEIDGVPCALAWGMRDAHDPSIAHVAQMWVAPDWRRHGIAQRLLDALIEWAGSLGVDALELRVTCGNEPAARLYAAGGFRDFGETEPLRPGSTLSVQPMRLVL